MVHLPIPVVYVIDHVEKAATRNKVPDSIIRYEYANNRENRKERHYDRVMSVPGQPMSKTKKTEQSSGHNATFSWRPLRRRLHHPNGRLRHWHG